MNEGTGNRFSPATPDASVPATSASPPRFPISPLQRVLHWWHLVPKAESFGVLVGVLGFELLLAGKAHLSRALIASAVFAVLAPIVRHLWLRFRGGGR